jgi:hypothetical protein
MGWVFQRPVLTAIEVAWRWLFGAPLLLLCWIETQKILAALPPESAGLSTLDPQNPWVVAVQLSNTWALYQPPVAAVLRWLLPLAALAWVIVSGLGRSLILKRMIFSEREQRKQFSKIEQENSAGAKAQDLMSGTFGTTKVVPCYKAGLPSNFSAVCFRPMAMIALQAAWLAFFALTCWGWLRSMQWVASTHIIPNAEPDLIGFAIWTIFLSLGFFTAWALTSWAFSIAPFVMLLENRSALSALGQSLRLGRPMTAKLVEINMVMGIVNLALLVLAMVLSAAPLPFGDQLGAEALHAVWAVATVFYFVASDYFQVVRLKGFQEFCKMYRGPQISASKS